jgi:Flp pilus assembly secretin CpaC
VPAVNRRSIQTRLILDQDKTVILGGFTVDSKGSDVSKTPGLGDIPILGYLFKRKVNRAEISRLYFAISVEIVPFGQIIEPVVVPGATTEVPTISPEMLRPIVKTEKKAETDKPKTGN